ncbi:L-amino acid N-acyltransferase YncA [Bradyrhizobium elkanii]|uniref:GNAT family N-acetyltransferase n=1 Tax=Bradyrhizobium elkanii TaxID=29448 RepID=UPI0004B55F24|nr:N-acetyltransferase [Bradyrhizobium elkanii]MCP1968591.1 L-amino acid N-acyltransferase YncA [Bradyrhizobium elkanii]MCS4109907.1 L-amino acid N-acyltransferase YncA [Bradyrhizobium elkanii]
MIKTRLATSPDADSISALLTANGGDRGGMLLGQWPREVIETRIANGQPIVVATDDEGRLLGALLTSEKGYDEAPPVQAMLKAWPGQADAYVYGPVCVSRDARGLGVLEALYAKLQATFPGREAILFIREDNPRSLKAHLRLGMREVARYDFAGKVLIVLSDRPDA